MLELESRELDIDPGIILSTGSRERELIRPGLLHIENILSRRDGIIVLATIVYGMDPRTNAMLVAPFEGGKMAELPGAVVSPTAISYREIHEWVVRGGRWFIEDARVGQLDQR